MTLCFPKEAREIYHLSQTTLFENNVLDYVTRLLLV